MRMTTAQALVRFLIAQRTEIDGREAPLVAGVFAIFGHGNVAGLGEALHATRGALPTWRGHNEQSMAHAATAFAKAQNRRQLCAVTTSIGPGATNLVTAAATAHLNRLPLLLLPGDTFASRRPDPVLQQLEDFGDLGRSVNDCLRPVSRFWDRIVRPEQLVASLPVAMEALTNPAGCGPVTLALPQDVQAEAFDFPEELFAPHLHRMRRPRPDGRELDRAAEILRAARRPLIVAGGGVHYSLACGTLAELGARYGIPIAETQAGKGALAWDHPCNVGGIGVTGSAAANELAAEADVVLAVGTRLTDFTTASRTLFPQARIVALNAAPFDAIKHRAGPLIADAREGLAALSRALEGWAAAGDWTTRARRSYAAWQEVVERATRAPRSRPLSDAHVLGAINRQAGPEDIVVCAAGGAPGELHKLWRVKGVGGYHVEYGYSCMGYEIAGGLGVKMARPEREVLVVVGDGSYLMANSEIATAVAAEHKLTIVVLDNRGFGCIHRLQEATGGAPFGNLLTGPRIDFAAHAASLGAVAEKVDSIGALEAALGRARAGRSTSVIVVETDPALSTREGGAWWEVPVPAVSERAEVRRAFEARKR